MPDQNMTKDEFIRQVRDVMEPLRRFLTALCSGDAFTADDLAQDALAKAWVSIHQFTGGPGFRSWIFRIGYSTWLNRRYRPSGSDLSEGLYAVADEGRTPGDAMESDECGNLLYSSIAGLNPKEKAAVLLFYMEDKSISEIADIMGTSTGSVKMLLTRGRNNIREFMKRNEYEKRY